jgi:sRNA-binding regulator protein Hfq
MVFRPRLSCRPQDHREPHGRPRSRLLNRPQAWRNRGHGVLPRCRHEPAKPPKVHRDQAQPTATQAPVPPPNPYTGCQNSFFRFARKTKRPVEFIFADGSTITARIIDSDSFSIEVEHDMIIFKGAIRSMRLPLDQSAA